MRALAGEEMVIHGDGSQIRAWCFVDDVVEALLAMLEREEAVGQVFNVGNPRSVVTVFDLASRIKRLAESDSEIVFKPLHYTDVEMRIPNVDKALKLLEWEPRVDLDDGLARTIAWYRERQPVQSLAPSRVKLVLAAAVVLVAAVPGAAARQAPALRISLDRPGLQPERQRRQRHADRAHERCARNAARPARLRLGRPALGLAADPHRRLLDLAGPDLERHDRRPAARSATGPTK